MTSAPGFGHSDWPLKILQPITGLKTSGQSYKGSMIVNYDSRVVPDLKITYITTLKSKFTIVKPL